MLKKFLTGTVVALALLVGVTAAAADFGTTTLKVGSKGDAVKAVQTLVGATADGSFGPMTAAKVKVWQAANGLTADGVFGAASKAKANGTSVSTTTTSTTTTSSSTTLSGGAGDSDYASYGTGVKSSIKDGEEGVKVIGMKIEAIDSDVAVDNMKVQLSTGTGTASTKVSKYIDSVEIYKGSTKVGSADVADFTKGSSSVYTKSIALSNAVVKADDKDPFFVVFNAVNDIDTDEDGYDINVDVLSYRFTDATGLVTTKTAGDLDQAVSLDLATSNDVSLKSLSGNPDATTVTVDANDTTDDVLALAFKLDVDSDSTSDASVVTLPVVLTFTNASGTGSDWAEKIVESVTVKIDGDEYDAEYAASTDTTYNGSGSATYTADVDSDTIIDAGDTAEVKVYITFAEQEDNYIENTTVQAKVIDGNVIVEDQDQDSITVTGGDKTGGLLTLNTSALELSNVSWTTASGKTSGVIDLLFTVKAGNDDITITASDITDTITHATDPGVLTLVSGDAEEGSTGEFTITEGDTANFMMEYSFNVDAAKVKATIIKGQSVPDSKQLSPTVFLQ